MKAIIKPDSTQGDGGGSNDRCATIIDCTSGATYTAARRVWNAPHGQYVEPNVGTIVIFYDSSATYRCGIVTGWNNATIVSATIQQTASDCSFCSSTPTGSDSFWSVHVCDRSGGGWGFHNVFNPDSLSAPSAGEVVKIRIGSGTQYCGTVLKGPWDGTYTSATDYKLSAVGIADCATCLGYTPPTTLYVCAIVSECSTGTKYFARRGSSVANVGSVVKIVKEDGTVKCGIVTNLYYDYTYNSVIADGVADCSSCDDSTSGSDDWHVVWDCDSDVMVPYVYNPDSVSGVAAGTVVKYGKVGGSDICGTIQTGTVSGTYSSGTDYRIISTETNCTTCASGATSEYTVSPCAGGADVGVDDPSVLAGGIGDFIIYVNGGNSYCGEITGGTFSGASSGDVDDGGYADCTECEEMLP